jgi:hypothetical protein
MLKCAFKPYQLKENPWLAACGRNVGYADDIRGCFLRAQEKSNEKYQLQFSAVVIKELHFLDLSLVFCTL